MGRYSRSVSRSRSRTRQDDAYDEDQDGYRVHVADLGVDCSQKELERVFSKFGEFRELWLARNPPCFAFIVYKHRSDGEEAIKEMDGRVVCNSRIRVSWARPRTRGRNSRFDPNMRCYQCGEKGHFSRDCNGGRRYNDRYDDRRGRRRRSRSRTRSRSRRRDRRRSYSRSRSRTRSRSARRHRSRSGSRDKRRRQRSRSTNRYHRRNRSYSRSRSHNRRSRSRSRSQSQKNGVSNRMETNGSSQVKNGDNNHNSRSRSMTRSRSRSMKRSRSRSQNSKHSDHNNQSPRTDNSPVNHANGDIYDPTQPDDEDDANKLDISNSNGEAIVNADYQSDNAEEEN